MRQCSGLDGSFLLSYLNPSYSSCRYKYFNVLIILSIHVIDKETGQKVPKKGSIHTNEHCLLYYYYARIGMTALANAAFSSCAASRSLPKVVKYVLILGSVPEGLTMTTAPSSRS